MADPNSLADDDEVPFRQVLLDGIDFNARRLARWNAPGDKGIDTDRRL
jgi:hypothetical protein